MKVSKVVASLAIVALVVSSSAGMGAAASTGNSAINYSAGPNAQIAEDYVTINQHDVGDMGPLQYYDDSGEVTTLPAHLNSSTNNHFKVNYGKVQTAAYGEFPRYDGAGSALNASQWTASGLTVSQSDGASASGVDSVTFEGTPASGASQSATFSLSQNLDDAPKRVLFVSFDAPTVQSGTTVNATVTAASGATKTVQLVDPDGNASDATTFAAASGSGYVGQVKLNDVATSGAGSFDEIASLNITVSDADATVRVTGLDLAHKTKQALGEHSVDGDTESFYQVTTAGAHNVSALDSLTSLVGTNATIHKLEVHDLIYAAADAPADQVSQSIEDAPNYQYPKKLDSYEQIRVPAAIALSHHGLSFQSEQKFVSPRYVTAETSSGTGDTAFTNVSSWTDRTSMYGGHVGDMHTFSSTVQPGQNYNLHLTILLKSSDVSALQDVGGGGAAVATSGGAWYTGIPVIGGFIGLLVGVVAMVRSKLGA